MNARRLLVLLRDGLTVIVPILVAMLLAQQLSLHDQRNRAAIVADLVLNRTLMTTRQLNEAFARLDAFEAAEACSPAAKALMWQIDLGSSLLQGVGHIVGNTLACSSLGEMGPIDVGPYDYVSATQTYFRRQRDLGIVPGTPMLILSDKAGSAGLVHPALIFDLTDTGHDMPAGIVGYSTRENIIYTGSTVFDWRGANLPEGVFNGVVQLGSHLVAWDRSRISDAFTYAAVPLAAVTDEFWMLARLLVPLAALMGLVGVPLVRRIAAAQASLPAMLKAGLKRGEILAVYQPIVDLETGRWVGAEALARWQRPGNESVSPNVFVPIAERYGLVSRLTRAIIDSCCAQVGAFGSSHPDFFVSINISSADLRDPDFAAMLAAVCDAKGVTRRAIHLEITERSEVDSSGEAETIRTLRGMGFRVGIDDFGMGYSNLAYLDLLEVDYLKIDRAFVAGLSRGQFGAQIVDHIIDLASERGLELIAEGIEREEQRAELLRRGVRLGQGWLFAAAMPFAEFERAYGEHRAKPAQAMALADVA